MNSIDKNIFKSYETVETAFNNELHAFYPKAKTMKARTLRGTSYYFKSGKTGEKYDISAEECRILNLFYNTLNTLNKAQQADNMMSYYNGNVWWFERAEHRREAIEMVNGYIDVFEAWLNEKNETVEKNSEAAVEETSEAEVEATENVTEIETSENEPEVTSENVESETTTVADEKNEEVDVDRLIRELRVNGVISTEDKIIVNEDEKGIDLDVYENGRWRTNIVLYEYD